MQLPLFQIDAFTDRVFAGNPAAVVPLEEWIPEAQMQAIASENNLSETAFVVPKDDGSFAIRWFTPTVEVDLCGHATLATAHVLFGHDRVDGGILRLDSASGMLWVRELEDGRFELDFPSRSATLVEDEDRIAAVSTALRAEVVELYDAADLVAVVADRFAVEAVNPDFAAVAALPGWGLVVTAAADPDGEIDFVSRFFAPQQGIDEDPVTGSAHCILTPLWAAR